MVVPLPVPFILVMYLSHHATCKGKHAYDKFAKRKRPKGKIFYFYFYFLLLGKSSKGPKKDYSINGDTESRIFGIFNAIAIIATPYGNGIIPEIQAR